MRERRLLLSFRRLSRFPQRWVASTVTPHVQIFDTVANTPGGTFEEQRSTTVRAGAGARSSLIPSHTIHGESAARNAQVHCRIPLGNEPFRKHPNLSDHGSSGRMGYLPCVWFGFTFDHTSIILQFNRFCQALLVDVTLCQYPAVAARTPAVVSETWVRESTRRTFSVSSAGGTTIGAA